MRTLYLIIVLALTVACSDDPERPGETLDSGARDAGGDVASADTGLDATTPIDASSDVGSDASTDVGRDMDDIDMAPNPCGFRAPSTLSIYDDLDGLEDDALVNALNGIVAPHRGMTYDDARVAMYDSPGIDIDDDDTIEGIYTGLKVAPDGTKSPSGPAGQITTEHSWPRIDGAGQFPAEGDIHHLFPAISDANTRRGNHPFGITDCDEAGQAECTWAEGGSQLGEGVDGRDFVFEVRPSFRGDVARAHFYFAVRYELAIEQQEESILREWHCEDPPDLDELIRNDLIEGVQQNRNPFVDRPRLVDSISDF